MDELALAAGADPVAFRLAHMKDPRARAVIEKAAADGRLEAGSRRATAPRPRHRLLEVQESRLLCGGGCRRRGRSRERPRARHARWSATDAGLDHQSGRLIAQIEGGIIQSASWTLNEEVKFDRNGILSRDWASYPILTMPEVPKVEVELINRPAERSLGAGEGSQGPTVAAIANAFAHATGKRIRDLPFHPERVKAALA